MTRSAWKAVLVLLLVVAAVWLVLRRRPREERIAARYQELCDIAGDNVATPARGVDRLGAFFADHGPELLHDYGALVADIERISDDRRHDERARQAARVARAPLFACGATLQRFFEAVEADESANAKLTRGFERLGRTLRLLFGDDESLELRQLLVRLHAATTTR